MIRAIVNDGKIEPLDPLPADWKDGRELRVELSDDENESPEALSECVTQLSRLGTAQYEPGEREAIDELMLKADQEAKAHVRRQMGLAP